MKKGALFGLIVVVALVSACCPIPDIGGLIPVSGEELRGSGNVVTEDFDITGFDRVDASDAFHVDIRQGDTFSVVVRVDDNLVEYLDVVKQGTTLRIRLSAGLFLRVRDVTLEASVTMPELTGLVLSAASHGTITGFASTKALNVDVSGASHLTGDIEAGDATFDVSGASHVTLSGSAQDVSIDASDASHVDVGALPGANGNVEASGASHVTLNASGTLDASASDASHVYYLGSPTLGRIDTSGASSVEGR